MKYYITTPELAQGISAIKAQQQGCTGVTAFWWAITTNANGTQSALCISDEEAALSPGVEEYTDEEGNVVPAVPAQTVKTIYKNPPDAPTVTITTDDLVSELPADWVGAMGTEEQIP